MLKKDKKMKTDRPSDSNKFLEAFRKYKWVHSNRMNPFILIWMGRK
jgi:hypothetical protein